MPFATDSPRALFLLSEGYEHAGTVELTHPAGTETYQSLSHPVDEPPFHEFEGGPGTYEARIHEARASPFGFWGGFLGLQPIEEFAKLASLPEGRGHPCTLRDCS